MREFIMRIIVYLICFIICIFGLNSIDFARFLKKNKTTEAWVLYLILAMCLTYILGQFLMSIMYYFN